MRTFDNLSGTIIDHDELDRMFQRMKARQEAELTAKTQDEPQGKTWQCPRCGNPLDMLAEHAFAQLWECAQCGYSKVVKQ